MHCERLESRRVLTSYFVDTLSDAVADDGQLSFREALQAANTNVAVNEAAAGQSSATAIDSITFSPQLSNQSIELALGALSIVESIIIRADIAGSVSVDAGNASRVIDIASGSGEIVIEGLVLTGGRADSGGGIFVGADTLLRLNDVDLTDNLATGVNADQGGGGLYSDGATVVMSGGTISENSANGTSGSGGGLFNASGHVTLRDVQLFNNTANRAGGGIEQSGDTAELLLHSVTLSDNIAGPEGSAAPGNGGAVHLSGNGNADIFDTLVSGNVAAREGGGLWNGGGTMTVVDSMVQNNVASGDASHDGGGGIFNNGGTLNIFASHITDNAADGQSGSGGGVFSTSGFVNIDQSVISSNVANRAGGGIEILIGDLLLSDVTLGGAGSGLGNIAGPDGSAAPGNGGGLHVTGDGGATTTRVVITGGVVQGNIAASEGGGLWNQVGTRMTVTGGTRIGGNLARGQSNTEGGGGIFNNGGVLTLAGVNIANNAATGTAGGGGGIANDGGSVNVIDAMITGNFAAGVSGSGGGFLNLGTGTLQISRTEISGNVASRAGGGIEDASDTPDLLAVVLDDVILSENIAGVTSQDATAASPGNGGGIHVTGQSDLLIRDTLVTDNQAAREGGGLWNGTGTMTVENSIIQFNQAFGQAVDDGGGGIFNNGGSVIVRGSSITDNSATAGSGSGGGLFNLGGTLVVVESEISANQANRAGGGIEQAGDADLELRDVMLINNLAGPEGTAAPGNGGGVHLSGNGNALIIDGRVEGNIAAKEGGGLWNGGGTMTIDGTTIVGNAASGDAPDDGGGGIFNNGGDLVLNATNVTGNLADGSSGSGGGLLSLGGNVSISESSFEFNGANRAGGGIEVVEGVLTLTDSNLINNDVDATATGGTATPGNGGGLHVSGSADVTLIGGIVFGNVAASEGGGLWNQAGGTMTIDATRIEGNAALGDGADNGGGGIFNNGGILVVRNVELVGNFADGASGSGGGILNVSGGTVSVSDSLIADNVASRAGGGIEDASRAGGMILPGPSLTLTDVDLENNNAGVLDDGFGGGAFFSSPGNGGGIHVTGAGDVVIQGGRIVGNIAAKDGGGLWNSATGQMAVTGTVIENNSAIRGGGVYQQSTGELFRVQTSELTLDGVSIRNNVASGDQATDGGGGVYNDGGTVNINGGEISVNSASGDSGSGGGIFNAGTLTVDSAAISGNTANRAGGGVESVAGSTTVLVGVNLDNNTAGPAGLAAPGNGGGLHLTGDADATITGGTVSGNFAAAEGGGLWNGSGTMTIDGNALISGNIAAGSEADQGGGGVFNAGGTVQANDVMIVDNVAAGATTFPLSGNQEVPAVSTAAFGEAHFVFDAESESFLLDLFVSGIELTDETDLPQLTGAHIHLQSAGANGPVIVNLGIDQWVSERSGSRLRLGGIEFPSENIDALLAAGAYINIHSSDKPSGEIRGQIVFPTPQGSGGGVFNDSGSVSVANSTVSGNVASRAGGGIEATPGSVTNLMSVNLDDNVAGPDGLATPGNGGGLHLTGNADATLTGGTVSGNFAASEGGGLWNGAGTLTIDGTSIIGNAAAGDASDNGGGGIFNNGGDLVLTDAIVSGNLADGASGSGGGLLSLAGDVAVNNSSFEFNGANRAGGGIEIVDGTVTLTDSHLINNDVDGTATGGPPSPGNGGGLHVTGVANVTMTGGTVFGNFAASEGGGLWNQAGSTMTIDGTLVSGNTALGDAADNGGGGLFNNGGRLVLRDATVSDNFADGANGSGGGILNVSGGTVSITDSSITGNVASRAGGGIEDASEAGGGSVDGASLTLTNVILTGNNAGVVDDGNGGGSLFASPGNGGGIHVTGSGDVLITGGRVEQNIAAREGGGLWNGSGTMTIDGTLITENVASGDASDDGGGGIFNNGGDLVVFDASVRGNLADGANGSGGGIFNAGGELRLDNVVITDNAANRAGGGIEQSGDDAFAELLQVTFDSNVAGPAGSASPGNGGGLHIGDAGNGFIRRSTFIGNSAARDGGGIWNGAGSLTVIDTLISENIAGGDQPGQGGGGIYNLGTLTFTRGEITNNQATSGLGNGGGLLNASFANGSINESIINGNAAARAGGAIENFGNLLIGNATLAENSAGINGGALHISGFGIAIFTGSTIHDNNAAEEGGGLWNSADGLIAVQTSLIAANTATDGAGVFNDGTDGDVRLVNTTVSGNVASGMGGGVRSEGGEVLLTSVTIAANVADSGAGVDIVSGVATLSSSIIGDNSAASAPDIRGQVLSEGFNVVGNTDGSDIVGSGATDRLNVDPRLDALSDNGGKTPTHALLPDSPAINNGNPDGVPADQRLTSRPQGPGTDSGAFESDLAGVSLSPIQNSPLAADVNGDGVATPLDALRVINFLARGSNAASTSAESESTLADELRSMDVNGDNRITPIDALTVINFMARQAMSEVGTKTPPPTPDAIDAIALEEIRRRRDEIDELLLEQLAVDAITV